MSSKISVNFDEKTSKNLETIYKYSYDKWFCGEIKDKPYRITIVQSLINGLYDEMKKAGEI